MAESATVYLVGAGPGDPELLTLKAQRLLQAADVVVYDRLVSAAVLNMIPAGVTRIAAGKASGDHSMTQDEINNLLVRLARAGYSVVRLKGGDPFVFGRGGEEAEYLVAHGIAYEVVPGITAACACSAYAGIPLTHRDLSHGVRLITGHSRAGERLDLDWTRIADPDATIVIYMGVGHASDICGQLIAAGLAADTPAAAIAAGTTQQQQHFVATLADLPGRLRALGFQPPVTLVVGRVVALAPRLQWFSPQAAPAAAREGGVHA